MLSRLRLTLLLCAALAAAALAKPLAPTRDRAAKVQLTSTLSGTDLYRIRVGNQAGILKIFARDGHQVQFLKDSAQADVSGIDGLKWAPVNATQHDAILKALEIQAADTDKLAEDLMSHYADLPHLQVVALLGILAMPGVEGLSETQGLKVVRFLEGQLKSKDQGVVRRQVALTLALRPTVDVHTVNSVVDYMKRVQNNWETYSTIQFFTYHRGEIASMAEFEQIKKQVKKSGNPHAELILERLNTPPKDGPP